MLRPRLTQQESEQRRQRLQRALDNIPADHPWSRAIVELIDTLRTETELVLLAPPAAVSPEDRTYNAGRMAFADDLLARLEAAYRAAAKASEEEAGSSVAS